MGRRTVTQYANQIKRVLSLAAIPAGGPMVVHGGLEPLWSKVA